MFRWTLGTCTGFLLGSADVDDGCSFNFAGCIPIVKTLARKLREEAVREALCEFRTESLVHFGGQFVREAVQRQEVADD